MKKVCNIINKFIVPLTTVLILLVTVWIVTYSITTTRSYYSWQFEKNNTVAKMTLKATNGDYISYSEEDLIVMGNAICDYMAGRVDTLQCQDSTGKDVFSIQALKHMAEVKELYDRWNIMTIVCMVLLVLCIPYLIINFKDVKHKLFKETLITYSVIAGILVVVGIFMLLNFNWTFTMFHHILFPNQTSFRDAFFGTKSYYEEAPYICNTLLVTVLSIEVFMDAAWIILGSLLLVLGGWLFFASRFREKKVQTVTL